MKKPHIVLDRDSQGNERYLCSYPCAHGGFGPHYWYEWGCTWQIALGKMFLRMTRHGL